MKLSKKFLNDYIDFQKDFNVLAKDMTNIGNESDSTSKLVNATGLVIGEVVECVKHPESDHLHICKVNVGSDVLQIVCGAPNARQGIKVIVAQVGAQLPEISIKKSAIRGVESNGMLCSLAELGIGKMYLKPEEYEGIAELGDDAKVGEDPVKYLELDDEVVSFELTSNRGDLLSVLGMAYEIGALYDLKVKDVDTAHKENNENIKDCFNIDIQTENCSLFLAKKVKNVVVKDSPVWMKNRLIASGIRPINNVVDISNYVMLELGQPLHFYDADRLGQNLVVRMAHENEVLVTLDEQERTLCGRDIVIADKEKPVGLAGVMGGLSTEVKPDTKDIIIEAAIFDSIKVRQTARKILRSEASNRFEKGLEPGRTYLAIERACCLLEKYAGAEVVGGTLEHNNVKTGDKEIKITFEKINKVLGLEISREQVLDIYRRLGFKTTVDKDEIVVLVPSRRLDVNIKEDLVEEVGRIYGLDKIVSKMPKLDVKPGSYNKTMREIKNKMVSLGLNETLSYCLIKETDINKFTTDEFDYVKILDPMSEDRTTLRYSLLPSLYMIYEYNKVRNYKDICIFEMGKGFYKKDGQYKEDNKLAVLLTGKYYEGLDSQDVDFYILKGIVEEVLNYLGYGERYSLKVEDIPDELHFGQAASIIVEDEKVGIMGKIHPSVTKNNVFVMEINLDKLLKHKVNKMQFKEISKFPSVTKDLAFVVKKETKSEDIINVIKKAGGKLLTKVELFDLYTGESVGIDEKSLAYGLIFSDTTKTLGTEEVTEVFNKIINEVETKLNAKLRD